jgi:hypothetical protein
VGEECVGGVWGKVGDAATFLGLVVPAISNSNPVFWHKVILFTHVSGNEGLLWAAPVGVGGSILLVRVVLAPFWIIQNERRAADAAREATSKAAGEEKKQLEAELENGTKAVAAVVERLQKRVAELEQPAPRVTIRWTGDAGKPLVVKNVGPVEAHRVKIDDVEVAPEYVEFGEVDPLEPGEEKFPEFSCRSRGERYGSPMKATMFSWFLRHVGDTETWAVWREAAGLPPVADFSEDIPALEETLDLGPPKHALVVRYTDAAGARRFETEYKWWVDEGGEAIALEYQGWRAVG